MNKFYYLTKAIFEDEINEFEKNKVISELKACELLKELLPYLIHHKLLGHFYALIVKNNMISFLDKESWRLITRNIVYEKMKSDEYVYEIGKICKELEKRKINYVILKGLHLKNLLYENEDSLIRRTFNDIDILIERNDIRYISEILQDLEYFQGTYSPHFNKIEKFSRKEQVYFLLTSHQIPQYVKQSKFGDICVNDLIIVDVNFSIFEGGNIVDPISTKELLCGRVKRRDIRGNYYYSLKCEHDLFQIMYHFYKDTKYDIKKENGEQILLCNLVDIYRYIKLNGRKIEWNYFAELVKRANVVNEFSSIFSLLKQWTSCTFIDYILEYF